MHSTIATIFIAIATFTLIFFSAKAGIERKEQEECERWHQEQQGKYLPQLNRAQRPAKWQIEQCKTYRISL